MTRSHALIKSLCNRIFFYNAKHMISQRYSLTHSLTHPLTHSLTQSTGSLTHSLAHSLAHSLDLLENYSAERTCSRDYNVTQHYYVLSLCSHIIKSELSNTRGLFCDHSLCSNHSEPWGTCLNI